MSPRLPIVLALAVAASTVPGADARDITRARSDRMACADVQALVARDGAAVLRYPSARIDDYLLYDRYVADSGFCFGAKVAKETTVPAADTPHCPVYRCVDFEPPYLFDLFR
ncbi:MULTISPECIES: hypothetical protein [unclassified Roseitalea]|uniref:hypothetical protein n=1 Tax=unclassified Roseitalea TaxID=2639107 RepID=UPI00273EDD3E|nr:MULTISPECIES: hypothetical protein [unclassified Roseitalea]